MKVRFILIIGVWLFLCIGCTKQNSTASHGDNECRTDSLKKSGSINLTESGITGVDIIILTDNGLLMHQDYDAENPIYCLRGNDVIKGGSMGQGPDDVLEINSLKWSPDKGLYLYDGLKGRICFYQMEDSVLIMKSAVEVPRFLDDAVLVGDAVVIFPNIKEYSAAILDGNGAVIDSLMYFPPKPEGFSQQVHALACTGYTAELPSGEFARCVAYDGGVDFYAVENNKLKHINRFSLFDMEYTQINQGMDIPVPSDKSKTGFSIVKSSADKFYASFSDKLALENPEGLCDKIYQFSKNGELEQIYVLDCEFKDFAVNRDNKELQVLLDEDNNDVIRIYSL
ncbi:MAG: hypothetical protein K2M11_06750 [Paramuribaculum sp.]|nr:hypothetical protein [Paramuribaculum sp.]